MEAKEGKGLKMSEQEIEKKIVREVQKAMQKKPVMRDSGRAVKPDDDLSIHGWKKSMTVKYLSIKESGKIICEERDFYVKDFGNCECGSGDFLWIFPTKTGLGLACAYCRTASSTIDRRYGILRKTYEVSPEQAYQIMKEKGYNDRDMPMRKYIKKLKFKKARLYHKRKRPQ